MKRIFVIAAVFFLGVSLQAMAQEKPLKGPAYKNAHPSEKYAVNDQLLVRADDAKLAKGPKAKNRRPGVGQTEAEVIELDKLNGKNTKGLKGPAYKNYKPSKANKDNRR